MSNFKLIQASGVLPSPARVNAPTREPLRVGAVQTRFHEDPDEHKAVLAEGIEAAAAAGAKLVCNQEITLSPYVCWERRSEAAKPIQPEPLKSGPSYEFAAQMAAKTGAAIHISLYEEAPADDGRGFNTAIVVSPEGEILTRTRKTHIPISAGYYEDTWFRPGPAEDIAQVAEVCGAKAGFPTCWDQWFPELARLYALGGAEVIVYPTAIGSEPDFPGFDTEPLWRTVITANGISSGTFMVAVNRYGDEGPLSFYGSSFISDPYGRVLAAAGRDEDAVLVADLELDQCRDWLDLFPFNETRRPDAYNGLS
jgi:N-carbamoylputrescine amidase